jgi:16S rRNA (adenine1518-N6/adenine1519-N6)-dimethyltransferase
MIQYQCEATQLFIVPPEAFVPQPKVDSAIVYLKPLHTARENEVAIDDLNTVVTQAFSQRRKTISNTLKNMVSQTVLQNLDIDLKQRPETLSIEQYISITHAWLADKSDANQ